MPTQENSCVICSKLNSTYKCPKCRSVYCSLQCNKAHKAVCPSSSRQTDVTTLQQKDRAIERCKLALLSSESSDHQERMAILISRPPDKVENDFTDCRVATAEHAVASASSHHIDECVTESVEVLRNEANVAQISLISESSKIGTDVSSPKIINQEAVRMVLLEEIFNNYGDDESDNSVEVKTGAPKEMITNGIERNDGIVIDEIIDVETATTTDSSSSEEVMKTDEIRSLASTKRLHRDIGSNDSTILTSSTAQNLLQNVWVRNMLKSSRLRDDIASVDSSHNRQGSDNTIIVFHVCPIVLFRNASCFHFHYHYCHYFMELVIEREK